MKYYLDEEFIDDGKTIDLISIGIVAEDGRELYLQSVEFDEQKASDWVKENVLCGLPLCPCCGHKCNHEEQPTGKCRSKKCMWRNRAAIKAEILAFLDVEKYGYPELIGWCCAYDFVAFCQLFGTMMDVPRFIPHSMIDIQQILDERGITDDMLPKQEGQVHNALADARYIRTLYESLTQRRIIHDPCP